MTDLPSATAIQQARAILAGARRVAVLTGAGISAESGVPTYRGVSGVWKAFSAKDMASPEGFARDPERVWAWHNDRRLALASIAPNAGHRALADLERLLADRGDRFDLATQNIDGLHQAAGSRNVHELHGTILAIYCVVCGKRRWLGFDPVDGLPRCESCGGLLRPAIVWFGEVLPRDVWLAAANAATSSDVFMTIGTSAVVYPAAGLVEMAIGAGARTIEVNLEPTPASTLVDVALHGPAGNILPRLVPEA